MVKQAFTTQLEPITTNKKILCCTFTITTLKTFQSKSPTLIFMIHYVKTWNLSTWFLWRIVGCLTQLWESVDQKHYMASVQCFSSCNMLSVLRIIAMPLCKQCYTIEGGRNIYCPEISLLRWMERFLDQSGIKYHSSLRLEFGLMQHPKVKSQKQSVE